MLHKAGAITALSSFNTRGCIMSAPTALYGFRFESNFLTPSTMTSTGAMHEWQFWPSICWYLAASVIYLSFIGPCWEKTLLNFSFYKSALEGELVNTRSPPLKEAMPDFSQRMKTVLQRKKREKAATISKLFENSLKSNYYHFFLLCTFFCTGTDRGKGYFLHTRTYCERVLMLTAQVVSQLETCERGKGCKSKSFFILQRQRRCRVGKKRNIIIVNSRKLLSILKWLLIIVAITKLMGITKCSLFFFCSQLYLQSLYLFT